MATESPRREPASARRRSRLSGSSALREVIVLVAGILIAFGLDAWWDRRAERAEVRADLSAVLAELEENRRLIDQYLAWHARSSAATDSFLAMLQDAESMTINVPDSVIWGTGFTPSFDPRTGAISALLSSGRLALVDDPQLRTALAGFGGHLTDARDEEMRARSYTDAQLGAVLYRSGDMVRPNSAFEWRDEGGPSGGAQLFTTVRNSAELRNHLARRALFARLSIESLSTIRARMEALERMVSAFLE